MNIGGLTYSAKNVLIIFFISIIQPIQIWLPNYCEIFILTIKIIHTNNQIYNDNRHVINIDVYNV